MKCTPLLPAGSDSLSERQRSSHSASTSGRGFLLELQNVKFGYDAKRPVLNGVSLTVERGQVKLPPQASLNQNDDLSF